MHYPKITNKIITIDEAITAVRSYGFEVSDEYLTSLVFYKGKDQRMIEKKFEAIVELFIQALNEGWSPDWSNPQEHKYYPWFYMSSNPDLSSSGVSYNDYDYRATYSVVGSRLCLKNENLAIYVAKKYSSWYAMFMKPTIL